MTSFGEIGTGWGGGEWNRKIYETKKAQTAPHREHSMILDKKYVKDV